MTLSRRRFTGSGSFWNNVEDMDFWTWLIRIIWSLCSLLWAVFVRTSMSLIASATMRLIMTMLTIMTKVKTRGWARSGRHWENSDHNKTLAKLNNLTLLIAILLVTWFRKFKLLSNIPTWGGRINKWWRFLLESLFSGETIPSFIPPPAQPPPQH